MATVRPVRRRLSLIVLLVLVLTSFVACGGDDDDDVGDGGSSATTAADDSGGDDDDDAAATGAVDCDAIREGEQVLVGVQLLAQLRTQSQVDGIKSGSPPFDPDALIAVMEEFRAIGGIDDAIDVYVSAAEAAKVILANDGPVPQEDFDALEAITGPVDELGTFLGHQTTIAIAYDEACR